MGGNYQRSRLTVNFQRAINPEDIVLAVVVIPDLGWQEHTYVNCLTAVAA